MIDSSEKCNRQLAFELQNSHVCEKRSNSLNFSQFVNFNELPTKLIWATLDC